MLGPKRSFGLGFARSSRRRASTTFGRLTGLAPGQRLRALSAQVRDEPERTEHLRLRDQAGDLRLSAGDDGAFAPGWAAVEPVVVHVGDVFEQLLGDVAGR